MDWHSEAAEKATRKLLKKGVNFEVDLQELRIIAARSAFRSLPAITDFEPKGNNKELTSLAGFRACYLMDYCLQNGASEKIYLGLRKSIETLKESSSRIDPNSIESQMDHGAMVAWGSTVECIAEAARVFLPETKLNTKKDRRQSLDQVMRDSTFSRDHEAETKFALSMLNDLVTLKVSKTRLIPLLSSQPLIKPIIIDPNDPLRNHNKGVYLDDLSRNRSRLALNDDFGKPEESIWLTWLEKLYLGESPRLAMADGILSVPDVNWGLSFSSVYKSMDINALVRGAHEILNTLVATIDSLSISLSAIGHNSKEMSDAEHALRTSFSQIRETAVKASRSIEDRPTDVSELGKALTRFINAAKVASLYLLAKLDKGIDKVVETVAEAGTKWTFRAVAAVVVVKEADELGMLARLTEAAAEVAQTVVHLLGG